jgi:pyridoxal 5'-phosphate synthase pdxT subunit
MKIGVLSLQGDFREHIIKLSGIGAEVREVRLPGNLEGLSGLLIPGGESTTFGKLALSFGLIDPLREFGRHHAIWGTCAGAIFLARDVGQDQPGLGLMDMTVQRNAFGRQVDSFEVDLSVPELNSDNQHAASPFHSIFIRAPSITSIGRGVKVLARLPDGIIVAVREGRWLATCFHPELVSDDRWHRYFLKMASNS